MTTQTKPSVVDAAIALFPLSLRHRIEMEPEEALDWCQRLANAGEIDRRMTTIVQRVNLLIPKTKHGDAFHKFYPGREGSEVLYVGMAKLYLPHLDEAEWRSIRYSLLGISRECECDEFQVREDTDTWLECRFWYD